MVCDADLESIPIPEKPDLVYIFKYQKLIGELMFPCVNTCPEISYALSVLSRYLTKTTPQHGIHTKHLLRYVWGRRHAKLTWCAGKVNPPFQAGQFHSFQTRVGMMFYLLPHQLTVMTSSTTTQLCRGRLNFPQLLAHLQQNQN